ncbi:MAG: TfoX/Sxy family protein [Proteobacteria bacterium]|nr:TfoX/Sxy family protein [Pseudomonadota bacterium]
MDADHIADLFSRFAPVSVRRMFGGAGIFRDGVMFALVADDTIYLKADAQTVPAFEREGMQAFTHTSPGGRRTVMSYWHMPDRLLDDTEELARWASDAYAVAMRAAKPARAARPPRRR